MTTIIATRSRFINQAEVVARAIAARANRPRKYPAKIRRVLLAHHLLLGDTLMLTPLIAKVRERYPDAEISMTVPRAIAPLYSTHPYGVRALPWDPRHANEKLFSESRFDLAFVAGDNRYAWLAAAMHSRWIVAFSGDPNERKNWPIDELRRYPDVPAASGHANPVGGSTTAAASPRAGPASSIRQTAAPAARSASTSSTSAAGARSITVTSPRTPPSATRAPERRTNAAAVASPTATTQRSRSCSHSARQRPAWPKPT